MRTWKRGDSGEGVRLIQEWLCLRDVGVLIDDRFGPATEHAVRIFQRSRNLTDTGAVNTATWDALIEPYRVATAAVHAPGATLSEVVLMCAERHLAANAREVGGNNNGPWVRLYLGDRSRVAWCAAFVTYCLHQAAASIGVKPPLPRERFVPTLVANARARNRLIRSPAPEKRKSIKPGSIFVVRGRKSGYTHTGIVTSVEDDVFMTIEGNSNDDLQTNSYEVCRRIRSYEFETKDFIAVD